jgi:hypothetical protein
MRNGLLRSDMFTESVGYVLDHYVGELNTSLVGASCFIPVEDHDPVAKIAVGNAEKTSPAPCRHDPRRRPGSGLVADGHVLCCRTLVL